jgi:hypothetical protein
MKESDRLGKKFKWVSGPRILPGDKHMTGRYDDNTNKIVYDGHIRVVKDVIRGEDDVIRGEDGWIAVVDGGPGYSDGYHSTNQITLYDPARYVGTDKP